MQVARVDWGRKGANAGDQSLRHFKFLLIQRRGRTIQFLGTKHFAGKMHQLQDEEQPIRLHRREILAIVDDHLGDANFPGATKRLMEKRVRFFTALPWLKKVRLVKEFRIDLLQIDEVGDVDGIGGFYSDPLEILVA